MSAPTMSQFATRLDCLESRDKYHVARIEELEQKVRNLEYSIKMRDDHRAELERKNAELEKELSDARVSDSDVMAFVKEYLEAWDGGMAGDSYLLHMAEKLKAKRYVTPAATAEQKKGE